MADAGVLFLVGGLLVFEPAQVERFFHFQDMPPAVSYIIGMWGCVMGTMGVGYLVAAIDPLRHRVWVIVGILRGLFEFVLGIYYLVRGTVTVQQVGVGVVVAALITLAYLVLYPRLPRSEEPSKAPTPAPS